MSRKIIGIVGVYVGCYGLAVGANFLVPGSEWPAFIVLAAVMTVLLVVAIQQGRFSN